MCVPLFCIWLKFSLLFIGGVFWTHKSIHPVSRYIFTLVMSRRWTNVKHKTFTNDRSHGNKTREEAFHLHCNARVGLQTDEEKTAQHSANSWLVIETADFIVAGHCCHGPYHMHARDSWLTRILLVSEESLSNWDFLRLEYFMILFLSWRFHWLQNSEAYNRWEI